jgi:protein tyrosine phosphatase (PTP) superfamily phosphohydrolase (DUF442 family)
VTFTQVDQFVARGPRPQPEDYDYIKDTFTTVISLEGIREDKKEAAELSPVHVLSMPISAWEIYVSGISQAKLNQILGAIRSAPKPVLVHCEWGRDRTGLVVAAYRVAVNGWSKDKAMQEAIHRGFRRWPLNIGLLKTWQAFA